jgi:uncharacterized protein involved in exopolysaccharide biosynthesis
MTDQEIENNPPSSFGVDQFAAGAQGRFPGLTLLNFLTELARNKKVVGVVVGASLLLGVAYSYLLPILFTATAKIMTPRQNPSSAGMMSQLANSSSGALALAAAGGGFSMRNPNDIYIGLLSSRPIEDAIIQKFGMMDVYRVHDMTAARQRLAQNTSFTSEKSSLIAISFTDSDKKRAAEIANAYTAELGALTKDLALSEATRRRAFYEEQLKLATSDLADAQLALAQVQQTRGVIQPDAQAKAIVSGIAELHAQATAAQVELEALRSYSTEKNPKVQLVENQLNALRGQIAQAEQASPRPGSSDFGVKGVASAGMEFLRAEHELQYRQMLLDLLVRQYDAAKLDESNDATVIAVVETAIPPERKSAPHRASTVLGFLFVGLLGAVFYIFACDFLRRNREINRSLQGLKRALVGK